MSDIELSNVDTESKEIDPIITPETGDNQTTNTTTTVAIHEVIAALSSSFKRPPLQIPTEEEKGDTDQGKGTRSDNSDLSPDQSPSPSPNRRIPKSNVGRSRYGRRKSVNAIISPRSDQNVPTYISPAGGNVLFLQNQPINIKHMLTESRFIHWTREEMILVIVHIGIHILSEGEVSRLDLIEFCDQLFHGKSIPTKRPTWTEFEKTIMDIGIRKFQNLWILKRQDMINKQLQNSNMMMNQGMDFDFGDEMYDLNDEAVMYTSETADLRRSQRIKVQNSIQGQRIDLAAKLVTLLDTPWKSPDWLSAKRSLDFIHPRRGGKGGTEFDTMSTTTGRHCTLGGCGEQCDLWSEGVVSEYSIYGPGVTNYFKFLKWLYWLLLVLSIISLPVLVININGVVVAARGFSDLSSTTVGNLENLFYNGTVHIQLPLCSVDLYGPNACYLSRDTLGVFYMSVSIAVASLVLIAFIWLKIFENNEEVNLNKNTVYTSMYSIAVKNLPEDTTAKDLTSHFEFALQHGYRIIDVDFGYDNEREIEKCTQRGDLIKSKIHLVNVHRYQCTKIRQDPSLNFDQAESLVTKLRQQFYTQCKRIDKKLRSYDETLSVLEKKCDVPKVAFITFNECVGAHIAIELFQPSLFDKLLFNPMLYFKGKRLNVRKAPEPSTIIWENLQTPFRERFVRRFISTVSASCLIIISIVLAYSARLLQSSYTQANSECPVNFYDQSLDSQQQEAESNSQYLHCYCNQFSSVQQSSSSMCSNYFKQQLQSDLLITVASIVVLIVNSLIEYVIAYFADFEKHHSEDTKEKSIFIRLFILKFLNTGCIFLISSDQKVLSAANGSSYNITPEFNYAWFQSIGVTILLVQIGNIVAQHIPICFSYYWHHRKLKKAKANPNLALTQAELNKLHIGPQLQLSYRYSQLFSTFFVCMTFNTGMPLLNLIVTVNYLVFYAVEKYLFNNFYKAPYRFSSELGRTATMFIPVGVAINLAISIWTLSNENIFSSSTDSVSSSFTSKSTELGFGLLFQKCTYPQTFPLFIFLCAVVGGILAYYILKQLRLLWLRFWSWLQGDHKNEVSPQRQVEIAQSLGLGANIQGGFIRAVQRNLLKDLASYSILKNPVYKERFAISWKFAAKHRRASQVRLSSKHLFDDHAGGNVVDDEDDELLNRDDPIQGERMRRLRQSFESDAERSARMSEYNPSPHQSRKSSKRHSFSNTSSKTVTPKSQSRRHSADGVLVDPRSNKSNYHLSHPPITDSKSRIAVPANESTTPTANVKGSRRISENRTRSLRVSFAGVNGDSDADQLSDSDVSRSTTSSAPGSPKRNSASLSMRNSPGIGMNYSALRDSNDGARSGSHVMHIN